MIIVNLRLKNSETILRTRTVVLVAAGHQEMDRAVGPVGGK